MNYYYYYYYHHYHFLHCCYYFDPDTGRTGPDCSGQWWARVLPPPPSVHNPRWEGRVAEEVDFRGVQVEEKDRLVEDEAHQQMATEEVTLKRVLLPSSLHCQQWKDSLLFWAFSSSRSGQRPFNAQQKCNQLKINSEQAFLSLSLSSSPHLVLFGLNFGLK